MKKTNRVAPIYLDFSKRKLAQIDLKDYYEKYGSYEQKLEHRYFRNMVKGAPFIVHIYNGYYLLDKLPDICINGSMANLLDYIRMIKAADDTIVTKYMLIWR